MHEGQQISCRPKKSCAQLLTLEVIATLRLSRARKRERGTSGRWRASAAGGCWAAPLLESFVFWINYLWHYIQVCSADISYFLIAEVLEFIRPIFIHRPSGESKQCTYYFISLF